MNISAISQQQGIEREGAEDTHRIKISKIGRKHLFTINRIMSGHDEGIYTCHAVNDIGEAKHNFQVMSEFVSINYWWPSSYVLHIINHFNYLNGIYIVGGDETACYKTNFS